MDYDAEDEFGLYSLLRGFKLFKRGTRRKITHQLSSTKDLDTKSYIFDYQYKIGNKNNRKHRKQTVLFLNSKKLGLPEFSMEPEQPARAIKAMDARGSNIFFIVSLLFGFITPDSIARSIPRVC